MKTLLSILIVFVAAAAQALTPFTFHWYYSNGQPMTNTGYMTPYPPATQTTVLWGTNFVFGNSTTPIILQPNALGFGTNFAEPNQYRVYVTNNASPSAGFAFLVNITDTAITNDLATYAVAVPVVYTLSTSYGWVTNLLGYAPQVATFAALTNSLGYWPLTNTPGGITNTLGYVPLQPTFAAVTAALGSTFTGNVGVTNSGVPATLHVTNGVAVTLTIP